MTNTVESGEIHFFYRTRLGVRQPSGREDLERVFLALVPDDGKRARLFVIGRKHLPRILPGESDPSERHWLLLSMVDAPEAVGKALHPVRYDTETRGERQTSEAVPAGAGRYAIVSGDDASQLVYRLVAPRRPGPAQEALGIRQEARYVIAVRNPTVEVPGFPEEKPAYPEDIAGQFADERWIDVSDPRLLEYENAQLVLIGAHEETAPFSIPDDGRPDPFATFGLDPDAWPDEALRSGTFAEPKGAADPVEAGGDRSKGGRRGGAAAAKTDSAAGVAAALKGVSFPSDRAGLVRHAQGNEAPEEVIGLLRSIPDRRFETMADVTKAIGEVR
ncbi:MAG: DUF2795 domain-containing protein [Rhodosalinus sp.]